MLPRTTASTALHADTGDQSTHLNDGETTIRRVIRHRTILKIIACTALLGAALLSACSEDIYVGTGYENQPPTIQFVYGPATEDITVYKVHLYWMGCDMDGRIDHYEYVLVSGDPIGFDPADTTGMDKWTWTEDTDIRLEVSADEMDTTVVIDHNTYARFCKTHTFFVRAVDGGGLRSEATYRSFTAFTLAPSIAITSPEPKPANDTQFLPPIITFEWTGKDPIDSPANYQPIDSARYMYTIYYSRVLEDLNKNPEMFEHKWSPWVAFDAPADSGTYTILGDDEILKFNYIYIFVVQAMDEAGAVSSIFDERTNVMRFMVREPTGPNLAVREQYLGNFHFVGTGIMPVALNVPNGFPVNFRWSGDASAYGATVSTYRYGWDVRDLSDPNQWDVRASQFHTAAPERRFVAGVHSLYIESVDNIGVVTLAQIDVAVVPTRMDRDLLWVDDFLSDDFIQTSYATPTETQHDEFWIDICSCAKLFDPDLDIYDTADHGFLTPDITRMWRYKNIIWTYGTTRWDFNAWSQTVSFTTEKLLGGPGRRKYTYNILSFYMRLGGHIWSCGRSDSHGGLAACNPGMRMGWLQDIATTNLVFPLYVRCETFSGPTTGCPDTLGAISMPYKDFCVSVLDKVSGVLRPETPFRRIDYDALAHAYRDGTDPVTLAHTDLPGELHLWEEVTKPGRFFDPQVRGMHYVEIYDPNYWMQMKGLRSRSCFHPMYRMRTRNTVSPLNDMTIAIWSTVHADVIANATGAVPAASVHMGIPLWYFDHDEVRALADAIFREWHIKADD